MATAVELAVIEMQIVLRELNRRLGGIERRLGIEPEPVPARDRGRGMTPVAARAPAEVTRRAAEAVEPYEVAGRPGQSGPRETAEGMAELQREMVSGVPAAPEAQAGAEQAPAGAPAPEQAAAPATPQASRTVEPPPVPPPMARAAPYVPSREVPLMPPRGPGMPPPSAARVMRFIESHVPEKKESTLERTLGMEVVTWIAAFAIMAAMLFSLKLSMDYGYVFMRAWARVALAALAGTGMIGLGLWMERRKMWTLSACLQGAGVGTLMMAVFAANTAFAVPVLTRTQAFLTIPAAGLLGVALGLRRQRVELALLALLGMYASPWILGGGDDHARLVFGYLMVVTICAFGLAWMKRRWDLLRLFAFCVPWIWIVAWVGGDQVANNFDVGLVSIAAFFVLYLADMTGNLWLALRADPAQVLPQTDRAEYWDVISAVFSVVNTALALAACGLLFDKAHMSGIWFIALLLSAAMGAASRLMRTEYFSRSAEIQSLLLLVIAVPLYFDGVNITVAWAALSLLFGLHANWRNSEQSRAFMFGTLVLAAGRHFGLDFDTVWMQQAILWAGGNPISPWMLLGWGLGLLALALAWLSRPMTPRVGAESTQLAGAAWATISGIALSTALVFIVNTRALNPGDAFTLAAVLWGFALIALLRVRAMAEIDSALEALVAVLLMLLSVKWIAYDGISLEVNGRLAGILPFWNGFTLSGAAIAAAILALNPLRRQPAAGRRFLAWWMTALLFAFLNMQAIWCVDHFVPREIAGIGGPELFKNVVLTVLWAGFASVMIGLGFLRKSPSVRYVALVLLAFTVGKIIVVDMANVETILRVFSFLALGFLLSVVSYLYHKYVQQLSRNHELEQNL